MGSFHLEVPAKAPNGPHGALTAGLWLATPPLFQIIFSFDQALFVSNNISYVITTFVVYCSPPLEPSVYQVLESRVVPCLSGLGSMGSWFYACILYDYMFYWTQDFL